MDPWLIWLIIAVVLLVAEIFTLTAAVGMLGVAALVTAGFAAVGLPPPVQFLAFTVIATTGVVFIRPIAAAHLRPPAVRFGVEALSASLPMSCQRCRAWMAGFASAVSAERNGRRAPTTKRW